MAPCIERVYLFCVGINVEPLVGGVVGTAPPASSKANEAMRIQAKPETQTGRPTRPASNRCGNCSRTPSVLRPVSSSFPAFFQSSATDPKGFLGFAERRSLRAPHRSPAESHQDLAILPGLLGSPLH